MEQLVRTQHHLLHQLPRADSERSNRYFDWSTCETTRSQELDLRFKQCWSREIRTRYVHLILYLTIRVERELTSSFCEGSGALLHSGQVSKMISSYLGANKVSLLFSFTIDRRFRIVVDETPLRFLAFRIPLLERTNLTRAHSSRITS